MSGPTWLPPRTLESAERAVPQMSNSAGSAIYRAPNKKGVSDFRTKYGPYDNNGGGGGRYMATGPTGEKEGQKVLKATLIIINTYFQNAAPSDKVLIWYLIQTQIF